MIDGDVHAFVNGLYYGDESYFIYDGVKYFIQGWFDEGKHYLVLEQVLDCDKEPKDANAGYVWEYVSENSCECVQAFLEAKLWNGKKFYEVENSIIWIDP